MTSFHLQPLLSFFLRLFGSIIKMYEKVGDLQGWSTANLFLLQDVAWRRIGSQFWTQEIKERTRQSAEGADNPNYFSLMYFFIYSSYAIYNSRKKFLWTQKHYTMSVEKHLITVQCSCIPLFFLFLLSCLIHARMSDWGRAFVHRHTFLHSWSRPVTLVVGLLHGATCLSNLPLVLFVSFIGP